MLVNVLDMIPDDLKTQLRNTVVDFVVTQTEKHVGDEIARQIKQLRSDSVFIREFEQGLQRAVQRFVDEYEMEDEDLVLLIINDNNFFKSKAIQEALLSLIKNPTGYLPEKRKILERKFASVLPERKNRQRVNRAISYYLKCVVQEVWSLPELRPIYTLLFQSMTTDAAIQLVEIEKGKLHQLTELNINIKNALLKLTDALLQSALQTDYNKYAPHSFVPNNLPQPDYGRFIGRLEEIEQIRKILRPYPDSREHLISIDGIGGIGKSSLALEIAHRYNRDFERLPEKERFHFIVWTSAKQTVLTESGIVDRPQVLDTLESIITSISIVLGREDIGRAKANEKLEIVRTTLSQHRTLLIVDNLETVEDESVIMFLRELPAPTKAIVTTRHRIETAYPIHLTDMKEDEAFRLIEQESKKRGVYLNESEKKELCDRTGRVPLAIVLSIGLIGMGKDKKTILENLTNAESDIAKFCFESSLISIRSKDQNAYRVLLALSLFPSNANPDALAHIIGKSKRLTEESLKTLERFSLVNRIGNRIGNRYGMLPMTRSYVKAILENSGWINMLADRWVQWLIEWGERYGKDLDLHINDRTMIEMELENSIAALEWCYESRKWREYVLLVEGIFDYMLITNLFRPLEIIIERLKEIHIKYEIYSSLSLFMIGYYFWYLERYEEAMPYLQKALTTAKTEGETRVYAKAIDCQAHYLSRHGDIDKARKIVESLFTIAAKTNDRYLEFLGNYRLARIYQEEGNLQFSVNLLHKAKEIVSEEGWERLLAWTLYHEGVLLSHDKNKALNNFERSRAIAKIIKERSLEKLTSEAISLLKSEG